MRSWGALATACASAALAAGVALGAWEGLAAYRAVRITASGVITVAAVLLGFQLTALSMLIAVADRRFIRNLRMTGHYERLVRELLMSAGVWLAVIAAGLMSYVLMGEAQRALLALAFGLAAFGLLAFVRAGRKFALVVQLLAKG